MKLAIYGRLTSTTEPARLQAFFQFLHEQEVSYTVLAAYAEELREFQELAPYLNHNRFSRAEEIADADFLYSLGGDGTMLDALRFSWFYGIPVVGVNLGRLGFLATGSQSELIAITLELFRGNCRIEERGMIAVESAPDAIFAHNNVGLNDVTIHKAITNEMIVIHTFINGEFMNTFWCDGLIISTPTGSTAYSLACGGPIIMPQAGVFALTPIAPHSLTVRPIVISDGSIVSFEIETRSGQALVAVDSRTELVQSHMEIAVRKADSRAKLVKVHGPTYFSTLRQRLHWGTDIRN